MKYFVYWIISNRSSYIGACVKPERRLRQHNSEIVGGARRTRGKLWRFHCVISGFHTWRQALQYEFAFKHISKNCRGIQSRQIALEKLMQKERWTCNSCLASEVQLTYEYSPTKYGLPPEILPSPKFAKKTKTTTSRKWKKNLHGVKY